MQAKELLFVHSHGIIFGLSKIENIIEKTLGREE